MVWGAASSWKIVVITMQAIMGSQAQMATSVLRMLSPGSTGMGVQWLCSKMLPDAVTAPYPIK